MDFVKNENPVATRAGQRGCLDDVANFLNTVIAGSVQFENVITGTQFHCLAGITFTAGFALDGVLTVQNLGQDSGSGGFTGTTRP